MSIHGTIEVAEAGEADRQALCRLSPRWFRDHQPTKSWCAVEDGEIVAAAMLGVGSDGVASMEFHGGDETMISSAVDPLLERVLETARDCRARVLDANVDSLAALRHAELLQARGFEVYETFDLFEAPRTVLQEKLAQIQARTSGRIKSRFDGEIVEIQEIHIDSVAAANAAWIGGSVHRGILDMRARFHSRKPDDPERGLQLVATQEQTVVAFCCTRIIEPGVLKIDGEAVDPRFRLDPLHGRLAASIYERAEAVGIHTIRFEAGSRQPNTRAMVRRNRIESLHQRVHLRRIIGDQPT